MNGHSQLKQIRASFAILFKFCQMQLKVLVNHTHLFEFGIIPCKAEHSLRGMQYKKKKKKKVQENWFQYFQIKKTNCIMTIVITVSYDNGSIDITFEPTILVIIFWNFTLGCTIPLQCTLFCAPFHNSN